MTSTYATPSTLIHLHDMDDAMSVVTSSDFDVDMEYPRSEIASSVSEIYPEDSASWRGQNVARASTNKKGNKIPLSEMSEEPSVVSVDSQGTFLPFFHFDIRGLGAYSCQPRPPRS